MKARARSGEDALRAGGPAVAAASACHGDDDAVLLVVVTASGSPPAVVGAGGHAERPGRTDRRRPTRATGTAADRLPDDAERAAAQLRDRHISIDVRATDAAGATIASGHGGPITLGPGSARPSTCGSTAAASLRRRRRSAAAATAARRRPARAAATGASIRARPATPRSPPARPAPVRRRCDDHIPCTSDTPTGSELHRRVHCTRRFATCLPRRRLLPQAGRRATSIRDCSPTCGNGVVDPGETCDLRHPARHRRRLPDRLPTACRAPPAPRACWSRPTPARRSASATRSSRRCTDDGCCPPGATNAVDDDCPRALRQRRDRAGETCDVGIPPLAPGACPTSCDDGDPCTTDFFVGGRLPGRLPAPPDHRADLGRRLLPATNGKPTATADRHRLPAGLRQRRRRARRDLRRRLPDELPAPAPTAPLDRPAACAPQLVGDAATCTARCVVDEETACQPDRRTAAARPAAPPRQRRRLLAAVRRRRDRRRPAARCATRRVPPGDPGACPTSCARLRTRAPTICLVSAGTCAAACIHLPITALRPGDGCCPAAGANFLLDPDCAPMCGNGVVESPAERCDYRDRVLVPEPATRVRRRRLHPLRAQGDRRSPAARPASRRRSPPASTATAAARRAAPPPTTATARRSAATAWSSTGESCDRGDHRRHPGRLPAHVRRRQRLHGRLRVRARRGLHANLHAPADHRLHRRRRLLPARLLAANRPRLRRRTAATGGSARARPAIRPAPARPPARTTAIPARRERAGRRRRRRCSAACRHVPITACSGSTRRLAAARRAARRQTTATAERGPRRFPEISAARA